MTTSPLLTVLLAAITGCLVALTLTMMWTARSVRLTLSRVNAILPQADQAMRAARHSFLRVHRMLVRVDRAARQIETAVKAACRPLLQVVDQVEHWRHHTGTWLTHLVGNGAGSEPRQHHRKRSGTG